MCNVYVQKTPTVEGLQFDGENGDAIVEFVGGEDYGVVSGDTVILSLQGKDPRSTKVTVHRGQFVMKSKAGTAVVNEGEFMSNFTNLDGTLIAALPHPEAPPPLADEELVYQPGFGPLPEDHESRKSKKKKEKDEESEPAKGSW